METTATIAWPDAWWNWLLNNQDSSALRVSAMPAVSASRFRIGPPRNPSGPGKPTLNTRSLKRVANEAGMRTIKFGWPESKELMAKCRRAGTLLADDRVMKPSNKETTAVKDLSERIVVRDSKINGRGVFATGLLPKRRKLGEISGDLVQLPQARQAVERCSKIYFIELSRRLALDCSRGNDFKHLNHSCLPNCYLRVHLNRVEVYTLRKIPAGSELTVNYGVTPHVGGMICSCGAAGCVGRL